MWRFDIGGVIVTEVEPQLVVVDYGTALVTPERVRDVLDKAIEIWNGRRVTVLVKAAAAVDLRQIAAMEEESALEDFTIAVAIFLPSKVAQLLGNFFMKFRSSPYPLRQFSDEEKALAWLRSHIAADAPRHVMTG
ncbi:MAG: STAS/SEC14 domain-containing protein [Parvibaculum sp.]